MPQLTAKIPPASAPAPPARPVERVIRAMHERFEDVFPLNSMAKIAIQSRYYFSRRFHRETGVTARQFLCALRLEAAKRLLLTTKRSVTDVCFDVGYNSLGTFTTRFTRLVGVNPRALRRLATNIDMVARDPRPAAPPAQCKAAGPAIDGEIIAPDEFSGLVFVGAFATPIPQGSPLACALTIGSSAFRIGPLAEGTYYVMAAAVGRNDGALGWLLSDAQLRGRSGPVRVTRDGASAAATITLRPPIVTDPPILVALPRLLHLHARGGPASNRRGA